MGKGGRLAAEAEQICKPLIEDLGLELIDVDFITENHQKILRIYIDKRGGVGLNDCTAASHAVEGRLDSEFSYQAAYILELSSPGLDRGLTNDADILRHRDEEAELSLYKALDGEKKFVGLLQGVEDGRVILKVHALRDKKNRMITEERSLAFAWPDIAKIKRVIRF